jgi:hypothetical protein
MTDIVERLRDNSSPHYKVMREAADEIERLRAAIREAIAAEREACAKAVWDAGGDNVEFHVAAIRSRSNEGELYT